MKPIFKYDDENRERTRFRASDADKLAIDILLEFQGVPRTNPPQWFDTLKFGAGKGVELQMLKVLKQNGIVREDYDQDSEERTVIQREGVDIAMMFDAVGQQSVIKAGELLLPNTTEIVVNEGEVIEIKSINNKNSFDINDYANGKPRENYVKQLSIYMDALGKDRGHLFASAIDGLNYFWFVCEKIGDGIYKCGEVTVDINAEYKRFAEIWKRRNTPIENWFEECGRYKIPPEEVDWKKVSKTAIGEARNNRKVIGDEGQWKIMYSPFRDLILAGQGIDKRGYTDEELAKVNALTAGYTSATWLKS